MFFIFSTASKDINLKLDFYFSLLQSDFLQVNMVKTKANITECLKPPTKSKRWVHLLTLVKIQSLSNQLSILAQSVQNAQEPCN